MLYISIFCELQNRKYNGRAYGTKKLDIIYSKMLGINRNVLFLVLALWVNPIICEMEYFPGLRRPPSVSNWSPSQSDENSYLLAQLNSIIEEQARRRFQQQLAQQHYYQRQMQHQRGPNVPDQYVLEPSFTFQMPDSSKQIGIGNNDGRIPFAVTPGDPRYYKNSTKNGEIGSSEDEYEDSKLKLQLQGNIGVGHKIQDDVPYYKLKSPMDVNPKLPNENHILQNTIAARDDLTALVEKLQRSGHTNGILNQEQNDQKTEVIKKHMGIDGTMGMYVVALIAGVSAAVTVGLIALGIGWYTLHKRAKAAADVEYPAYGVTGPNKDASPSGDRRLAQSAQMYHYQHQKQQIIAMENRPTGDNQGVISDVESDDDNEEGDYTVYECPGLAPTGEMEVKNPLFLDDTPVTPSTNTAENQNQQQASINRQQLTDKSDLDPALHVQSGGKAKPETGK